MVNSITWIPDRVLMLVFVLQMLSFNWKILIMLMSQFPLTFHHIHNGMPCFISQLMTILVMIGMVFMIILGMFHERISVNSVLLLLPVNFVSGVRLKQENLSSKVSGQASVIFMFFSCLCCCHSSQKSLFFVCTKSINLLNLKKSSDMLVVVVKGFLKLPNLHVLIKQESISSQKLSSWDFWRIANSILNKGKSAIPPSSIQQHGGVYWCYASFSCNSMLCSGCSVLHGVNPN